MLTRRVRLAGPVDLRLTLGPLCRGRGDPTTRFAADGFWRATRTPDGPATVHLAAVGATEVMGTEVVGTAWGTGAAWVLDGLAHLVGASYDTSAFTPDHPVLARLHHRLPGLRIPATRRVFEAVVPAIVDQKVTALEARRSWRRLVLAHGTPAPGPVPLLLAPEATVLARLPYHAFHRFGLERRRTETIRRVATVAARIDEDPALAARRLRAVPGIGPWTVAEATRVALGDLDAVSVGDYHLPNQVAWALAGEPRADDDRMLELLEPFRPYRALAARLIEASGLGAPRFGPRQRLRDFAGW